MRDTSTASILFLLLALTACGDDSSAETPPEPVPSTQTAEPEGEPAAADPAPESPTALGESLERGLLVTYSPFTQSDSGQWTVPAAARLELITRTGGAWNTEVITDSESNVFHKALPFRLWDREGFVTIGGMKATVKLWYKADGEWRSELLWREDFGGRISRMRDVEVVTYGGIDHLAIATHDQGYLALLSPDPAEPPADVRPPAEGDFVRPGINVRRSARQENRFVHEIEVGDLDGDGTPEIYATPSDPNHMNGGAQRGEVVRFTPTGEGELETTVIADLGNRHAKEILVDDVDGDGRDELYVSVEGLTERGGGGMSVVEPVEVRRYDQGTAPDARVVIARIDGDHLMRFLTAGDVDGDGKKELVAAAFARGLWLLRPGSDPRGEWGVESFDRASGGFEHTSYLTDLNGDGFDELYVSSDNDGEIRRYEWHGGRARRSVITSRDEARSMITWNIVAAPIALLR